VAHEILVLRLSRLLVFWVAIASTVAATAQSDVGESLFRRDEDTLWKAFTGTPCTLIEEVPIVGLSVSVSAEAATLSSIVGYQERRMPFPGLHESVRLRQLAELPFFSALDERAQQLLVETVRQNTADQFDRFLKESRAFPDATEGEVRARILQQYGTTTIDRMLNAFAHDRLGEVHVDMRPLSGTWGVEAIKTPVDAKTPAALVIDVDGQRLVLTLVGYFQQNESIIVLDPRRARPKMVPAMQALLTEQDRLSTGELATRARERLKNRTVLLDEVTSCTAVTRPSGLRFLTRNVARAELFTVRNLTLSQSDLEQILRTKR
jgi:hypothetical protein